MSISKAKTNDKCEVKRIRIQWKPLNKFSRTHEYSKVPKSDKKETLGFTDSDLNLMI